MGFYQDRQASAGRMISRFGIEMTLRSVTGVSHDPATGSSSQTTEDQKFLGFIAGYRLGQIDGALIQAGDRRLIMEACGVRPSPGDTVLAGADAYRVIEVNALQPAGVPIVFDCQLRSA